MSMDRPSMDRRIREEARLIMLRELKGEPNGTITSTSMRNHLDEVWGIYRDREWVEAEFLWLAEMGAVALTEAGSVKIARITDRGRAHLRLARLIPGILAPTDPVV